MFSGTIWPLNALPTVLQFISLIFVPQTLANDSLRSMVIRNWGITHSHVWPGFVVTLAWIIGLWILAIFFAKRNVTLKN
jgi:ABC-type multidrug transport system permease subunit